MELVCRLDEAGLRPVLHLSGEIDLATLPALYDQLTRAIARHLGSTLWVDLDGVTTLDDTGLGLLLGAAGKARELGGDLRLVCTTPRLLERFEVTGFGRAVAVDAHLHD
jgi:anti-sigma B factor antagonist